MSFGGIVYVATTLCFLNLKTAASDTEGNDYNMASSNRYFHMGYIR